MARQVDKEVLVGFIEEAKSYLPAIRQGFDAYRADPATIDELEQAHRYTHTIKGASSMVGLTGLSHIAYYVEESLEETGGGQLPADDKMAEWLNQALMLIEHYLDGVMDDTLPEALLVAEATRAYRRLKNLPIEEDEAAIAEVLTEVIDELPTSSIDEDEDEDVVSFETFEIEEEAGFEAFETEEEAFTFEDDEAFELEDDISAELMEAFFLEAEEHMQTIGLMLNELSKSPEGKDLLQEVRRSVHTLKGAAGTVGLPTIAELSHRMEDLLDELYEGTRALNADIIDLLFASADTLEDLVGSDNVETNQASDALAPLYARYAALLDQAPATTQPHQKKPGTGPLSKEQLLDLTEAVPDLQKEAAQEASDKKPTISAPVREKEEPTRREAGEVVRVPIERLDELIRLVSEMVITRTAFEQHMGGLAREVDELRASLERMRRVSTKLETDYEASTLGGGIRHLALAGQGLPPQQVNALSPVGNLAYNPTQAQDFDELEFDRYTEFHLLSRELSETTSDVSTISNALKTLIGDFDSTLNRQSYLSSDLQEKLMRTRMVPLATLATRLHRAVRVVARKQDKQVELILEGEEIELDKTVLEELADPLLHILRNAVDHGLEPPALRQVTGKAERGQIHLHAYHQGNQVVIQISDDGAGIEPELLRAKAVSNGYIAETEAAQLSDEALRALVFLPGFSTAGQISDVSGRGVGLDVVKTNINKLKGTITLESTPGQGTTFTIRLPMTLAVTRALLVKANSETFAIPLNAVEQILRLEREDIEQVGQESVVRVGGQVYPVLHLGEVLKLRRPPDHDKSRLPVLILNVGGQQVALVVDHIVQGREIVIKPLGNHLRRVHGVMGATLMGDGSVVLILNPVELVTAPAQVQTPVYTPAVHHKTWEIMIVDDSVSVRRVLSNLIKNAGWQPVTAKDGLEALEIIQRSTQKPDLILLDIEMPRMDGYELAATLQGQDAYRDIPIVMLTSRSGEKHRRKAFDLGVSEYLVKPYQDETLLSIIRRLTQSANGAKPA